MSTKRKSMVHQRNFRDDKLRLEALTHKSYHYENPSTGPHNERLEFLGDSIVSFVVANYLHGRFPNFKEGQLTLLRANLVCKKKLAQFALQLGLDKDIRLGVGALRDGGRGSEKVLEDAFEAYIGAVFLDAGSSMSEVQKFMEPLLAPAVDELTHCSPNSTSVLKQKLFQQDNSNIQLQMLIADQILNSDLQDPINKLQTWSQRRGMGIPVYKPNSDEQNAVFSVGVYINGKCFGLGQARNKKDAKKAAAINALKHVTVNGQNNEFTPFKNELQQSHISSKHKYSLSKKILY
ncbi:ribonuclease III [Rhizophagus irregularis]|nr:ribonuclease III [Rhizophagus irregularis DAOM 181602=DAOM 197198]EXX54746.1 Rnt1p [Rhizophagus irregularis DAOM 197198w]PKC09299.1 ribonuclease III [Rhizophagus irregularis]PKC71842.1 ribonuclease III [Rhizophagus irregularis]PKK79977.1 ribonuclease III [Rhizophagus irregularis]PKY12729.1 ribonuclease III [Rhizophagus irregularis]|eukprot:XP_025180456.1 ribonuclease III [Rhizophagus irregularis DAOM 181602=DAOM 197198]